MLLTLLAGNLNQLRARPVEQIVPILVNEDTIYPASRLDLTRGLLFWRTVTPETETGEGLFQVSYRWLEAEPDYFRANHQLFFQFVQQIPVVPPVVPPAGGLLPGPPPWPEEMGQGMGPYRRPGQTFTDADQIVPSPFMSSRAEVAKTKPAQPSLLEPLVAATQNDDELVFALVALEELSGDWLSGPLTLHIIRKKV